MAQRWRFRNVCDHRFGQALGVNLNMWHQRYRENNIKKDIHKCPHDAELPAELEVGGALNSFTHEADPKLAPFGWSNTIISRFH